MHRLASHGRRFARELVLGALLFQSSLVFTGSAEAQQLPTNGKIFLKSYNGKYVQAVGGGGGAVGVYGEQPLGWEQFDVVNRSNSWELWHGNQVNLRAYDGVHFLQADCGGSWDLGSTACGVVNASATNQLDWETFTVEKLNNWHQGARINPGDQIALKAMNGAYCAAVGGGDGRLTCGAGSAQGWETFTIGWAGQGGGGTFQLVFQDDFSSLDTSVWTRYWGNPGSRPNAFWDPSHVKTQNGVLVLECYWDGAHPEANRTCGAVAAKGKAQTYGKWEVRARADWGPDMNAIALLWPYNDQWTHEIDFMEDWDGRRYDVEGTLHWLPDGKNNWEQNKLNVDMTQWHTYGVIWTPGKVEYTLDGNVWATQTGEIGWKVPDYPMWMALQIENMRELGSETPAHVNMYVDWIKQYSYQP